MLFPDVPRPLIVIVGPTAVGKTEIALQLAERMNGEIVSADSRLFYRGMNIGTAKPTCEELARVPHHLIDVADPDDTWSLALFQRAAREAIQSVHERGRLPFLVGGTGQYVRAVTEEWDLPSQEPDYRLRQILEKIGAEIGPQALHRQLAVIDLEAAARIEPNNIRRTIRALEVIFHTGQRFSVQRRKATSPYSLLQIGLIRPRPELYARVDARIDAMLAAGFVEEVKELLAKGYAPELPTLSAIGYREIIAYLQGRMTLEEAVAQMKRLTRNFVRRQANWFSQTDPTIHWFQVTAQTVADVEAFIRSGQGWILPGES
jgi:tRNA dimethylallyltransferase